MIEDGSGGATTWRRIALAMLQGAVFGALLGGAFIGGYLYHAHVSRSPADAVAYALVEEADALVANHYLYDLPDDEARIHGAISGLLSTLGDPYTYFVEPRTAEVDQSNLAGRFGGIGAELALDEQGRVVITRVYPGNPAAEAGVQDGDILLAVDDLDLESQPPDMTRVVAALRGEVGDPVRLRLLRGDEVLEFEIVRAEVLIPSVFWRTLEEDSRVGYIQITRFTDRTPDELQDALRELGGGASRAYVLDLRDNGGGLVDSAVRSVGEFVNGGVVLYEIRRGESERVFNASRGGLALDEPLAVLVNGGTASAAEIAAGALQDRGRAILIGERTYGKGSVQLILSMSDGSSLHVTSAEWYTPDRHRIQAQGLEPGVVVEPQEGSDAALGAALEALHSTLTVAANE